MSAITICSIDLLDLYSKELKSYVHMYKNINDSFIDINKYQSYHKCPIETYTRYKV